MALIASNKQFDIYVPVISENQIKLSENWLNNAINRPVQVSIPVSVDKSELQELIDSYKEEISTAQELGIDINKTIYGNIDTNNRQILEWTDTPMECGLLSTLQGRPHAQEQELANIK